MTSIMLGTAILLTIQAIAIWINRAPRGYQDETGFHFENDKLRTLFFGMKR